MKLLLDTHIWLWSRGQTARITPAVLAAIENGENELWLSPLSIWELSNLVEKGRIILGSELEDWLETAMARVPMREASLTYEVAIETRRVRLPHRDPVDRFLVATARVYDLTLVTADARLLGVKGIRILANR